MPHESQVVGWPGRTLFDADGSKVGKIEDVFADERTGRPAWATVSSGLFGRRHHFVPIENAREVQDGVAVPVAGQVVKGAPNVDADGDLSRDDERALYRHYGLDDGELDGPDAATTGTAAVDADHDGRDDRTEHDARPDDAPAATGYAHHDERTHHDADGDGRDDRLATRHDADGDGRDDRLEPHADADGRTEGHDREAAARDDDARGSGVPPTLQADATTEALARAERERLAAAEAEHDRLAARQAAPPAHEPAVLDRELAQHDLSVTPPGGDRHLDGPDRDRAAGESAPAPVPGRSTDGSYAASAVDGSADGNRTPGSPGTGTPSVGTRLRRLARSITPSSKDDHHG